MTALSPDIDTLESLDFAIPCIGVDCSNAAEWTGDTWCSVGQHRITTMLCTPCRDAWVELVQRSREAIGNKAPVRCLAHLCAVPDLVWVHL